MIVFIILGVLVLLAIVYFMIFNGLVSLKNRCEEAFATMDIYLKKRYDLIPNLVSTIKGYAKHESETLESVIKARNNAVAANNSNDRIQSDKEFSSMLSKLMMLKESYPELKADIQFINLQKELSSIETDIAQSRKYYNAVAREWNTKIQTVPSNIVAAICHYTKRDYYMIENEEERNNVKVEF